MREGGKVAAIRSLEVTAGGETLSARDSASLRSGYFGYGSPGARGYSKSVGGARVTANGPLTFSFGELFKIEHRPGRTVTVRAVVEVRGGGASGTRELVSATGRRLREACGSGTRRRRDRAGRHPIALYRRHDGRPHHSHCAPGPPRMPPAGPGRPRRVVGAGAWGRASRALLAGPKYVALDTLSGCHPSPTRRMKLRAVGFSDAPGSWPIGVAMWTARRAN